GGPGCARAATVLRALSALTSDTLLEAWKQRAPRFYEAVREARRDLEARKVPYRQAEMIGRYGWLSPLVAEVLRKRPDARERTLSDRIDAVLTHRVAGPLIFFVLLLLIFQAIFSWAVPFMDAIEAAVAWTGEQVRAVMPDGFLEDLIVDGAITGVGNVLVFLPQILLLFFFLGIMEDTGYMARTAFIMDRLMRRLGLSGASVVPLLSGYACAVPAIMAARTLDNERDRIITIMVTPLMSCSARLPVYTLFISAFIPNIPILGPLNAQGLAMFSLYLLGTAMAFAAAWVLKTFVFKGESAYFVMELPPYRAPQLKQIIYRMIDRAKAFVTRAGKIIFGLSIVIWFLASFPRAELDPELAAERRRWKPGTRTPAIASKPSAPRLRHSRSWKRPMKRAWRLPPTPKPPARSARASSGAWAMRWSRSCGRWASTGRSRPASSLPSRPAR
uniref:ferrous iron transporter B n=1 Tax=Rhodothermus marinus TaxID=29549 RepID=UPI000AB4BD21